jgi:hypothetical protein
MFVAFAVERPRTGPDCIVVGSCENVTPYLHARYGRVHVITVKHDRRLALGPVW